MQLIEFLNNYETELNAKIIKNTSPVFNPEKYDDVDFALSSKIQSISKITPYQPQTDVMIATRKQLDKTGAIFVVAEMSCGKSLMSILSVVIQKKPGRHIIMCPPHLVVKWVNEVNKVIPESVGVVFNFNGKDCITRLKKLPKQKPKVHEFYVASRERWKNSYAWRHAFYESKVKSHSGRIYTVYRCPSCGSRIDFDLWSEGRKNVCAGCKEPLWEADKTKQQRFSPAEYVKKKMKKHYFNTLIADELHELKGESAQGVAFGQLACRCKEVIGLTGTLLGGYADDIFYLLWRMFPSLMVKHGEKFDGKKGWIEKYGILEKVFKTNSDDNKATRSLLRLTSTKRKPGISPIVLSQFLIPNSIFMKLADLHGALPPYTEEIHQIDMDEATGCEYANFEADLYDALKDSLRTGDKTVLSRMLQSLLSWPDDCRNTKEVMNRDDEVVATANAQEIDITEKEKALVDIILQNKKRGRKVLVYVEYTGTKDITGGLDGILKAKGISTLHLKSTVQAEKRQVWIEHQMQNGTYDCMMCNPRLVQTGLDLLDFPTIVYFQTGMSVYVLRQASRRSWRLGQTRDVIVHYMTYAKTMQEKLLTLMAKKMETSLSIEGDLDENGLSALSDSHDNIVLEMARSIVNKTSFGSLELAWQKYRKAEQHVTGIPETTTKVEQEQEKEQNNVVPFPPRIKTKHIRKAPPVRMVQMELFAM